MPDAQRNFLTGLVNQEIVDMYVRDHKIADRPEYKQELDRMISFISTCYEYQIFCRRSSSSN